MLGSLSLACLMGEDGEVGGGESMGRVCNWSCIIYVDGSGALTNGCLTELLISHLAGNVGPHQHAHGDAKALPNQFRDELQPIGAFVYPLGIGWSSGQIPFLPN